MSTLGSSRLSSGDQHKLLQKCPLCVLWGKSLPWHAVKRKVGVEYSPGISLGVGFTRKSHWHCEAEAMKGKQTWLLFPRGLWLALHHTMQTLSMLVLDVDFLFVSIPCLLPEDKFTCLLSSFPCPWKLSLLVLKGTYWLCIYELDKDLTYRSWTCQAFGRRQQPGQMSGDFSAGPHSLLLILLPEENPKD